jgi:hypothetical protein
MIARGLPRIAYRHSTIVETFSDRKSEKDLSSTPLSSAPQTAR